MRDCSVAKGESERLVARYPYRDAQGRLLFERLRYEPKRFESFDLDGQTVPGIPVQVLYRLPELLDADPAQTVWYVESEKDANRLADGGLVATTNPGGSRVGWQPPYAQHFRGRHVVLLPDADKPGRRLADAVEAGLRGVAASVVRIELARLRRSEDVSDWLSRRGGSMVALQDLAARARMTLAGLSRRPRGRVEQINLALQARLDTLAKLALVILIQHSNHMEGEGIGRRADVVRITAAELASRCGCHRVTPQRTLTALHRQGLLRRVKRGSEIVWDMLAALSPEPVLLAPDPAEASPRTGRDGSAGR